MKFNLNGNLFANVNEMIDADKQWSHKDQKPIKHYIIHGCNAQGVMGSGFAKALRQNYPKAYEMYKLHEKESGLALGTYSTATIGSVVIFNLITQENYGRDGKQYVSYKAVKNGFQEIMEFSEGDFSQGHIVRLHYPKIGAGLGGGDWDTIEAIIDKAVYGKYDQYLHLG